MPYLHHTEAIAEFTQQVSSEGEGEPLSEVEVWCGCAPHDSSPRGLRLATEEPAHYIAVGGRKRRGNGSIWDEEEEL